ncbi:hypothetical protein A3860_12255 [Niastella vici]|uniref:DUF2975 domain-containing protein n=1 Tax=Niastella vici TaxID=1703345 RepID=A0A1V9G6S1_9BACT|nr:DUF2975 domain-containing protein [Niastella vici]OQP66270.1 hypothetical protein A3860_12255 [Niastella vici]
MRKRSRSVLALVVTGIVITWFILTFWGTTTSNENFSGRVTTDIYLTYDDDTAFGGLFANPAPVNDSLPHYLYQHLADSIKRMNEERQLENRGVSMEGGWAFGSLGMYTLHTPITSLEEKIRIKHITDRLDSLTIAANNKIARLTNEDSIRRIKDQLRDTTAYFNRMLNQRVPMPDNLHYLSLQGYSLPESTKFFVQNGTYNLAYLKIDSVKQSHSDTWRYGHYERKQIPVRYSAENKMLFIPVSAQLYKVLSIAGPLASCLLVAAGCYFFLGFPLQILINISRGNAFDDKNVRRLNLMALALLIATVGTILSPYIIRLCFWKMIPDDFIFPGIWSKVAAKTQLFIAVVVIYITGKAFQKGNKLQKEQDLTI